VRVKTRFAEGRTMNDRPGRIGPYKNSAPLPEADLAKLRRLREEQTLDQLSRVLEVGTSTLNGALFGAPVRESTRTKIGFKLKEL
jgi:hypothetical protein